MQALLAGLALLAAGTAPAQATQPLRGSVLVATARTRDTAFAETVVLVVQHDRTRGVGLVLNRPLGAPLATLFPDLRKAAAGAEPLWAGGPVEIGINALIAGRQVGSAAVFPGVRLLADRTRIHDLLLANTAATRQRIRVYAGLCNWGPGQLEDEIERRLWRVDDASAAVVFDAHPESLWKRLSAVGPHR
jgi:putative transcriptional regulator